MSTAAIHHCWNRAGPRWAWPPLPPWVWAAAYIPRATNLNLPQSRECMRPCGAAARPTQPNSPLQPHWTRLQCLPVAMTDADRQRIQTWVGPMPRESTRLDASVVAALGGIAAQRDMWPAHHADAVMSWSRRRACVHYTHHRHLQPLLEHVEYRMRIGTLSRRPHDWRSATVQRDLAQTLCDAGLATSLPDASTHDAGLLGNLHVVWRMHLCFFMWDVYRECLPSAQSSVDQCLKLLDRAVDAVEWSDRWRAVVPVPTGHGHMYHHAWCMAMQGLLPWLDHHASRWTPAQAQIVQDIWTRVEILTYPTSMHSVCPRTFAMEIWEAQMAVFEQCVRRRNQIPSKITHCAGTWSNAQLQQLLQSVNLLTRTASFVANAYNIHAPPA